MSNVSISGIDKNRWAFPAKADIKDVVVALTGYQKDGSPRKDPTVFVFHNGQRIEFDSDDLKMAVEGIRSYLKGNITNTLKKYLGNFGITNTGEVVDALKLETAALKSNKADGQVVAKTRNYDGPDKSFVSEDGENFEVQIGADGKAFYTNTNSGESYYLDPE